MRYITLLFAYFLWFGPVWADDKYLSDDAKQALARHTASQASLVQIRAQVRSEVTWLPDSKLRTAMGRPIDELNLTIGDFTRSGDQIRMDEKAGAVVTRSVLKNLSTNRSTLHVEGGERTGEVVSKGSNLNSNIDLCDGCLYFLLRPVPPDYETHVTLASAIAKARKVTTNREQLDGVDTIRFDLDMADDGSRIQVWLDPAANYLWRRIRNTPRGKPGADLRVVTFAEPVPGVFCPSRTEKIVHGATKVVLTISDIKIDPPIPPKTFKPDLPPGSVINNELDGKVYVVGEGGKQKVFSSQTAPAQIINAHDPASGTAPTPLFADEPRQFSWSRIVLIASVLFALAGVALLYRRRKATG